MKLSRRHGALRLRFEPFEVPLLVSLLEDFVARLREARSAPGSSASDDVERRLFPSAYADDEAASEFRELTESVLREEREQRALACRDDLTAVDTELTVTAEEGQRWIQVLNDLRLVLGTQLDITEDDAPDVDPGDPEAPARSVYYWLTYLQDSMVRALMR
jgi:hypothetical protein